MENTYQVNAVLCISSYTRTEHTYHTLRFNLNIIYHAHIMLIVRVQRSTEYESNYSPHQHVVLLQSGGKHIALPCAGAQVKRSVGGKFTAAPQQQGLITLRAYASNSQITLAAIVLASVIRVRGVSGPLVVSASAHCFECRVN